MQPAACGLCSPATGGTGAAASCGVARAASRAARERPTVPLGTADSWRTCASGWFSAGLLALAATGPTIGHNCAGSILRRALQGSVQVMADGTITPPHPTTHRRSPLAPPQYVPMSHDHIDPWGAGQGWSRSRTPYPRPFCNPEHSRSRTRARLQPLCPSPLLLDSALVRFSGACLSRAQTTHVLISTAHRRGHIGPSAARARARCARRGSYFCLAPKWGSLAHLPEQERQLPDL